MRTFSTRSLARMSLFAVLTAIFAQIVFPVPFTPVHFSLSIMGVFLCGALLPKGQAALSQIVYVLMGVVGLPVFGKFTGGLGVLIGPTGGYILAYPLMALVVALCVEKYKGRASFAHALGMGLALIILHLLGSGYLAIVGRMTFVQALAAGTLPFIALDCVKVLATAAIAPTLARALQRAHIAA
nr:biotin transporter BioY [Maliibacterium massiliense]